MGKQETQKLHLLTQMLHAVLPTNTQNRLKLEMWVDAQPDGRPAEYRWRPLFNAAKLADAHY